MYKRAPGAARAVLRRPFPRLTRDPMDLIDADSGPVGLAGRQESSTQRSAPQLQGKGLKAAHVGEEWSATSREDSSIRRPRTLRRSPGEGNHRSKLMKGPDRAGLQELPCSHDHVQCRASHPQHVECRQETGPREERCSTIYRDDAVTGEQPTLDRAQNMFRRCLLRQLSATTVAVGRVKMNMRLELDAPDNPSHR